MKKEEWECKRCGKCCKFIVIPVADDVDIETGAYLDAHGIALLPPPTPSPSGGGPGRGQVKLVIPAICQYLKKGDLRGDKGEYYCTIHNDKFACCRLGGEKECKEAQKAWLILHPNE